MPEERTEKRPRTVTETDVESTQSRQKKGQMKSIVLNDSEEEDIVDFVKQHEELYTKIHTKFKDNQLAASRNLSINTVKKRFETQHTRYGKLTHKKSGQAAVKSIERQNWLRDSFSFL